MTATEYMTRMLELGYPHPNLSLWVNDDGQIDGSAGYRGTCGHDNNSSKQAPTWGALITELFNHVTNGGKRYSRRR